MKKIILVAIVSINIVACDVLHEAGKVASTVLAVPTSGEAAGGLKDALSQGFGKGVDALSLKGAFSNNNLIKILLPSDAQTIANKLTDLGFGGEVDKVISKLNEGAENAVATAKPIFLGAVKNMSFTDAMSILTGGKGAATNYLKQTTTSALTASFRPEIQKALDQVGVTKLWTPLVDKYNLFASKKLNPDLNAHVTEKALGALFNKVETEENAIRENPVNRATDLMKKAFAYADSQKK